MIKILEKDIRLIVRGRPFDSEGGGVGGGGGWHFLEINILTLKMLEINNLSSSEKKINNLTLTCKNLGEKYKKKFQKMFRSLRSRQFNLKNFPARFASIKLKHVYS